MKNIADMKCLEQKRQDMIANWKGRHFTNMLDEIFFLQKMFGKKFVNFDGLTGKEKTAWTKEFILCMMDEMSEVLNWTAWKHWKKYKGHKVDTINLKYELVDMLHFLVSLMLVWGMSPEEVFSMYVVKNRENHSRQRKGY